METFTRWTGRAAPLLRADVDTDQIIPTRFLLRTSEDGLGEGLFANWRTPAGAAGDARQAEEDVFVLDRPAYRDASILLAGRNFGCGSSREAAPRALRQAGFRVVIAPSFGDIFFGNCFRNGLLPVRLPDQAVQAIAAQVVRSEGQRQVTVDLQSQQVSLAGGDPPSDPQPFDTPQGLRDMLLSGEDEIDRTLRLRSLIEGFRAADRIRRPWAYPSRRAG